MKKIDLGQISSRDYENRLLRPEEILSWFRNENAYWIYDGEPSPKKAHAELTSGLCSNGFFDCLLVLRYPNIAEILGRQLGEISMERIGRVDWVVSSSYAAITFGHEVAKTLGAIFMLVEKDPDDPKGKKMVWRRMTIPAEAQVLQVEELISTSGTFKEVRRAVEDGNSVKPVNFISSVEALIHRPPKLPIEYDGRRVIAVIEKEIQAFDPKECPYCAVGSPRYRPKIHWAELTGKK